MVFGGVRALQDVSFAVGQGEVHCLAGENGSGKSTLIKVFAGVYQPEPGAWMAYFGKSAAANTPNLARKCGIAVIWQDLALFGLLMFTTSGRVIHDLPERRTSRMAVLSLPAAGGASAEFILPVLVMEAAMAATWFLITYTTTGRQLYAFGDNPEGARRAGISAVAMRFISFGWMGLMAGIGGLMQVNIVQEVVPNALIGRELDVLGAVVLGGARLGGGRGSVLGCFLGVLLVAITQNGLNLLGVSPFAFKMVIGVIILIAISMSKLNLSGFAQAAARRA